MRKLLGVLTVAVAAVVAGPGQAADFPQYPPIDVPEVDYGLSGSFYLRGSVGLNALWAPDMNYFCGSIACGGGSVGPFAVTQAGYGYSFGAGFGYETGDGLRVDLTVDRLANDNLYAPFGTGTDNITLGLRSTIALANVYYDFPFGSVGSAAGGFGAYVGAGVGAAYNQVSDIAIPPGNAPSGNSVEAVGALMAGVTYDMGNVVMDLGYRGLYMNKITNQATVMTGSPGNFFVNNAMVHELRGTVRYRFN